MAMADRADLLDRLCLALSRPGVNGVLGTPDVIEDLLLLGALRRQGRRRLDEPGWPAGLGLRDWTTGSPPTTPRRWRPWATRAGRCCCASTRTTRRRSALWSPAAGRSVTSRGARLLAMIEPFWSRRGSDGRVRNELTAEAMIRAMTVAAGIGAHICLHVVEGSRRAGHGTGDGGDHTARP